MTGKGRSPWGERPFRLLGMALDSLIFPRVARKKWRRLVGVFAIYSANEVATGELAMVVAELVVAGLVRGNRGVGSQPGNGRGRGDVANLSEAVELVALWGLLNRACPLHFPPCRTGEGRAEKPGNFPRAGALNGKNSSPYPRQGIGPQGSVRGLAADGSPYP